MENSATFDVTSEDKDDFKTVLSLGFSKKTKVQAFRVKISDEGIGTLILVAWVGTKDDVITLPFGMEFDLAVDWAYAWLKDKKYPPNQGDVIKGWRVFRKQNWGGEIARIEPAWIYCGK